MTTETITPTTEPVEPIATEAPQPDEQDFGDIVEPIKTGRQRPASSQAQVIGKYLGFGALGLFVMVAVILAIVFNNGGSQAETQTTQTPESTAEATPDPRIAKIVDQNQDFMVQDALGDQQEVVATTTQAGDPSKPTETQATDKPKEAQQPQPTPPPASPPPVQAQPVVRARPRRIYRPQPVAQPVATPSTAKPTTTSTARPKARTKATPVAQAPKETVDPYERFSRMQAFAQFSNRDQYQSSAPTGEYDTPETSIIPIADVGETITPIADAEVIPEPASEVRPETVSDIRPETIPVPVGTTVKAKLLTAVAWADDVPSEGATVLGQLEEDLGSLTEGTILTFKVQTASQAGFVVLKAEAASINGQTIALAEALTVTGKKGEPLQAKQKGTGGGIQFRDIVGVGLAGVSQATTHINRPRTNTTLASDGISQVVTDNQRGSVIAAIGQGATERLLQTAQSRTQQLQSSKASYWSLASGSKIQITVTDNVQL